VPIRGLDIAMTLPVLEEGFDRDAIFDWIERIERGPYASLCFGERISFSNPDAVALMAAAAVLTRRVRLVTTVMIAPIHSPVLLAKQCATIDVLSSGRLTLGVGIGGREEDFRAVGADPVLQRNERLGEIVGALRRVWAGEIVVPGARSAVGPAPVQKGGPPVLCGAMGPRATRLAARWADGLCGFSWGPRPEGARPAFALASHVWTLRDMEKQFEGARRAWKEAGRERPPRLAVGFWFALGARGREQIEAHLRRYLNWLAPGEVEPLLPLSGFAGSAAELRTLLRQIAELGADEVQLVSTALDPDQVERVAEAIA
jgi:alkanesulfonate monooxygenase SsuD/methylene tetrahydromethanopterin reductase-like flavin-dependent oxidoreductase (luciferase family)